MYEERPQEPKKRYLCKEKGNISNACFSKHKNEKLKDLILGLLLDSY